ncbi:unnamed protein product [Pseudo-nitzschia multistriata]|uniref:CoA-binding domain-containing protein n=1 Tax=Pseudo-nitzschia multistriata TaxID=183589 RepID=A0A448Z0R4_9STRA|nr:unnamed protein product [Pseudo-nitzschia multistriata]
MPGSSSMLVTIQRPTRVFFPARFVSLALSSVLVVLALFVSQESTALSTATNNSMFRNNPETIRRVLLNAKTIAVVGASPKPERPSNFVMKFLLDHGYEVVPVNPGLAGKQIHGQTVYASLSEIPVSGNKGIDIVDVFRNSAAVPPIVDEAISVGAGCVWMQSGIVNEEAAATATEAGLDVVMDACPKIELPRLLPTGSEL